MRTLPPLSTTRTRSPISRLRLPCRRRVSFQCRQGVIFECRLTGGTCTPTSCRRGIRVSDASSAPREAEVVRDAEIARPATGSGDGRRTACPHRTGSDEDTPPGLAAPVMRARAHLLCDPRPAGRVPAPIETARPRRLPSRTAPPSSTAVRDEDWRCGLGPSSAGPRILQARGLVRPRYRDPRESGTILRR